MYTQRTSDLLPPRKLSARLILDLSIDFGDARQMIAELKTLIAVCKHGSFASAGEHVGLTQSAVSSQIRRIEEGLGYPLFDRTGRSATLKAAGRTVLERAEVTDDSASLRDAA